MLLDLWEWFLLINDGIDLVFSNLASGTYPIPVSFVAVFLLLGFISFFAWRSTDIPDLPPAPRPPYVIQITAGPGSGGPRQTIADVRLLSGGTFFDGEVLTRYQNISRNQATITDSNANAQASGTGTALTHSTVIRALRDNPVDIQNFRRRIPGRSLLLGLFRRPNNSLARPVPTVPNAIRAQLAAPNFVVYHRVNVYHHHIHSHLGNNSGNPAGTGSNQASSGESPQNPTITVSSSSASSPVPQPTPFNSSQLPDLSSVSEINRLQGNDAQVSNISAHSNGTAAEHEISSVGNSANPVLQVNSTFSGINSSEIFGPEYQALSTPDNNMSARSGGESHQQSSSDPACDSATSPQTPVSGGTSPDGSDVRFTIKFLNDTQTEVTSQLGEKIGDFKRRHFATEMSENKTVRLIFNGRVLDNDNKTLREFGIFDHCVVHCLIVNRQQNQDQSRNSGMGGTGRNIGSPGDGVQGNVRRIVGLPEPGMFFVAFVGIFLIFLWFICLHFGQHLFTQSAVVSLTVLTAIFLIGIVACYLPLPAN